MNWQELKDEIDQEIEDLGLSASDVEFWYIDDQAVQLRPDRLKIHIGDPHHPGVYELWID